MTRWSAARIVSRRLSAGSAGSSSAASSSLLLTSGPWSVVGMTWIDGWLQNFESIGKRAMSSSKSGHQKLQRQGGSSSSSSSSSSSGKGGGGAVYQLLKKSPPQVNGFALHPPQQEDRRRQVQVVEDKTDQVETTKRSGTPINRTPRARAAARARVIQATSEGATLVNPKNVSPVADSSEASSSSLSPSDKLRDLPPIETYNPIHDQTHFIKGGTPCDPAAPPFQLSAYGEESLYTLVLLRHGESEWNRKNLYTGWCDVVLTARGEQEARNAGRLLKENSIELDHAFTSVLKRAAYSTNLCLDMADQHWVPVTKSWRLNERHYGALQGYNKDDAWEILGLDQEEVMQMRRSYSTRPPVMADDHPYWHGKDRRYKKMSDDQLERTRTESLEDTADRILPFYHSVITPSLRAGNKCIIVSHANTLRTLIKHIDNISDEDIKGMSIPTGIPMLYRLDKDLRPVDPNMEQEFRYMVEPRGYTWGTSRQHGFHGVYLGDLERLQEIQRKRDMTNRDWQRIILKNIAQTVEDEEYSHDFDGMPPSTTTPGPPPGATVGGAVLPVRSLWWKVHTKTQSKEFGNMLLLAKMKDYLEDQMSNNPNNRTRRRHHITRAAYEAVVNKLHLDAEGKVIEPFQSLTDHQDRAERARRYYQALALDLEEECLIK